MDRSSRVAAGRRRPRVAQDWARGGREDDRLVCIALSDGQYRIFDVFPDNGGRLAHLTGRVPRELVKNARSLVGGLPDIDMLDVLAAKVGG